MRGRMNDRKSYAKPVEIGEVMQGGTVGKVVESKNDKFAVGDTVSGLWGWQEFAVSDGSDIRKVIPDLPPSSALGVLGMPGLTGYFGFLDLCQPNEGETVVVSGAAGAVGSLVGQIAKLKGCKVVGIAGTDEKVKWLTDELGFDAAFNYKNVDNYYEKIGELCPEGVDCYFDNVGGPITDAVMGNLNTHARISVCGQISQYNAEKAEKSTRWLFRLVEKQARIEGFLVFQFAPKFKEGVEQLAEWVRSGKIVYRENIVDGIENAPAAFIGLFHGNNIGKQLVKVSDS